MSLDLDTAFKRFRSDLLRDSAKLQIAKQHMIDILNQHNVSGLTSHIIPIPNSLTTVDSNELFVDAYCNMSKFMDRLVYKVAIPREILSLFHRDDLISLVTVGTFVRYPDLEGVWMSVNRENLIEAYYIAIGHGKKSIVQASSLDPITALLKVNFNIERDTCMSLLPAGADSLFAHQKRAINLAVKSQANENILISHATGTGKTLVSSLVAACRTMDTDGKLVLVLAPLELQQNITSRLAELKASPDQLKRFVFCSTTTKLTIATQDVIDGCHLCNENKLVAMTDIKQVYIIIDEYHLLFGKGMGTAADKYLSPKGVALNDCIDLLRKYNKLTGIVALSGTSLYGFSNYRQELERVASMSWFLFEPRDAKQRKLTRTEMETKRDTTIAPFEDTNGHVSRGQFIDGVRSMWPQRKVDSFYPPPLIDINEYHIPVSSAAIVGPSGNRKSTETWDDLFLASFTEIKQHILEWELLITANKLNELFFYLMTTKRIVVTVNEGNARRADLISYLKTIAQEQKLDGSVIFAQDPDDKTQSLLKRWNSDSKLKGIFVLPKKLHVGISVKYVDIVIQLDPMPISQVTQLIGRVTRIEPSLSSSTAPIKQKEVIFIQAVDATAESIKVVDYGKLMNDIYPDQIPVDQKFDDWRKNAKPNNVNI